MYSTITSDPVTATFAYSCVYGTVRLVALGAGYLYKYPKKEEECTCKSTEAAKKIALEVLGFSVPIIVGWCYGFPSQQKVVGIAVGCGVMLEIVKSLASAFFDPPFQHQSATDN